MNTPPKMPQFGKMQVPLIGQRPSQEQIQAQIQSQVQGAIMHLSMGIYMRLASQHVGDPVRLKELAKECKDAARYFFEESE